jgi:hypothetical protein
MGHLAHVGLHEALWRASRTIAGTSRWGESLCEEACQVVHGVLTVSWRKVPRPGTATFGDPSAPATMAAFSAAGTYVRELWASDGAASTTDRVRVRVRAP